MKVLFDTHAWVWWLTAPEKLGRKGRAAIETALSNSECYLSSISVLEVSQLVRKGRLIMATDLWQWLSEGLAMPGLRVLNLDPELAYQSTVIPGEFHADPADRILVASARMLDATLITKDAQISAYRGVRTLW